MTLSLKPSTRENKLGIDIEHFDHKRPVVMIQKGTDVLLLNIVGCRRLLVHTLMDSEELKLLVRGYGEIVGVASCGREFYGSGNFATLGHCVWKGLNLIHLQSNGRRWYHVLQS